MALAMFSASTANVAGVAVNGCTPSCVAVTSPAAKKCCSHDTLSNTLFLTTTTRQNYPTEILHYH